MKSLGVYQRETKITLRAVETNLNNFVCFVSKKLRKLGDGPATVMFRIQLSRLTDTLTQANTRVRPRYVHGVCCFSWGEEIC